MDPVADRDLLWIAQEALNAPLPSEWTEHEECVQRSPRTSAATGCVLTLRTPVVRALCVSAQLRREPVLLQLTDQRERVGAPAG